MHDRKVTLLKQRLERRHRRMQAELPVQIQHVLLLDRNRRTHRVVVLLLIRHHDVQSVGRATLKQHHQFLSARLRRCALGHHAPHQETRYHRGPDERQRSIFHKASPRDPAPRPIAAIHVTSPVALIDRVLPGFRHFGSPRPPSQPCI